MGSGVHAARVRHCPVHTRFHHKALSSLNSARPGMQYSLLCIVPGQAKPVQRYSNPIAYTHNSSTTSSNVYVPFPVASHASARIDVSCAANATAKPLTAAASLLHTTSRVKDFMCFLQTRPKKLITCASLSGFCSTGGWRSTKADTLLNTVRTAASAGTCEHRYSKILSWYASTDLCSFCGFSLMPLRMAATAAWRATLATAAGSLRAYKAAALLLPPLLLSTCCCEIHAAITAPSPLMRSQSALIPAITIAALSLTSSPPPSDLLKQSGSFAASVQPRRVGKREDVCSKETVGLNCSRRGGLLRMLRCRSPYTFFPLETLTFCPLWNAAESNSDIGDTKDTDDLTTGACSRQCICRSFSEGHSVSGGRSSGCSGCEAFLSPLLTMKNHDFSGWTMGSGCKQRCNRVAAYATTSCSMAERQTLSGGGAATSIGHVFALASPASPSAAVGGDGALCTAETIAQDGLNVHQQPQHPAFDLLWQEPVPEMQLHVAYYVHRRTGLRVVSIAAAPQEKEKVFCVSFRTPVSDSTGVPHILEHSVLSGSKKYPVKEPFAELLKGSLYSFLNAYTYAEHTTYPVASINTRDFYNLASVYLDAVLQPRVAHDIDIFRQEGWRIEATLPGSATGIIEGNIRTACPVQQAELQEVEETTKKDADKEKVLEDEGSLWRQRPGAAEPSSADEAALKNSVKLSYQGVVLNEMKGVYSQPSSLLYNLRMKTIFPDISAYAQDSGGNPEIIPTLTYDHFKTFYDRHYSLPNARVLFWGSDDSYKRLEFLESNISQLDVIPPRDDYSDRTTQINEQPAFKAPVRVRQPYPATTAEMEDYVTVSWVLDPATSAEPLPVERKAAAGGSAGESEGLTEGTLVTKKPLSATDRLALTVLDYLLMGTSAAPLYKALAGSHLGKEVIGGLSEYKHLVFSAGLKGIPQEEQSNVGGARPGITSSVAGESARKDSVTRVEEVILETLEKCVRDGFEKDAIEAAVNTVEFRLREMNTGAYPKGLAVILQIISDWMVDRDLLMSLKFEKPLQDLKQRLQQGKPVFQDLLQKLFLSNQHRATVHLAADANLEKEMQRKEEAKIEKLRESLTSRDVKRLVAATQELKAKQLAPDSPEALATIPTLELSDVEEEEEIPTEAHGLAHGAVHVLLHELPTAGILYVDVLLPLHKLNVEEIQFLTLFARMLTQAGTSEMDEVALANYIGMHTGGVHATVDIRTVGKTPLYVPNPHDTLGFLVVSGKALKHKIPQLFDIISLILADANFSNSGRGIEILKEIHASSADSFVNSGILAALRIGATFTTSGYVAEQRGGIPYALFIRQQLEQAQQDWKAIQKKLEIIREKLLTAAKEHSNESFLPPTERVIALINLAGDAETLKKATSAEELGGRKLRELAKRIAPASSLAAGEFAGASQQRDRMPPSTPKGETMAQVHSESNIPETTPSDRRSEQRGIVHRESDNTTETDPFEKVDYVQKGTRIMAACEWSSVLKKQDENTLTRSVSAAAQGFVIPTQVNYVYMGGRMLSPGERYFGHMSVVAEALSSNYVWDQIRVVGGAYGGSFSVDRAGIYLFRSYRDPQLLDTLQRYTEAAAGLDEFTEGLTKRRLTRAIIAVLRGLSQPQSNDQKSYTALWRHIAGETKDHRAQYREEVLQTSTEHFRQFATRLQKLLVVSTPEGTQETGYAYKGQPIVAVVGSDKAFDEAMSGCMEVEREEGAKGGGTIRAPTGRCPLRFKLLDVKKATATTAPTSGTLDTTTAAVSD